MSSIMRARSALTGRWEESEVIGGASLKPKIAGPSMLGIGCPDRHALLLTHPPPSPKCTGRDARPPARAGSFLDPELPFITSTSRWWSRLRSGHSLQDFPTW